MKKRHNPKERVGIHRIGYTIEEEFEWVFREQPIADVGIDALVEKCVDGNPCGKFLALQIKSGEGNVHEGTGEYVYYISNVHYYYWTSIDMPILLLLYSSKKKKIFWIELSKSKIKKTKTRWKISIPFGNVFDKKSFKKINEITIKGKGKMMLIKNDDGYSDQIVNFENLKFANESISLLSHYNKIYTDHINRGTETFKEIMSIEDEVEKKTRIMILRSNLIAVFDTLASRIYNEIHIFASLFAKSIISYKFCFLYLKDSKNEDQITENLNSLKILMSAFDNANNGTSKMRDSIVNLQKDDLLNFSESMEKAIVALNTVLTEFAVCQNLLSELCNVVK